MRKLFVSLASAALFGALLFGAPAPLYAAANDIYVGSADDDLPASSCLDPDFSTDPSDEVDINSALDAALAAVDDDGDTIIICDGEYQYEADIDQHDGDLAHNVITIEAAAGAEVTLSGDTLYQLFNFTNMDSVSISGIALVDAQVTGSGAAIAFDGDALTVSECSFTENVATADGAAIYSDGGDVTVDNCEFTGNVSPDNGAIFVDHAGAMEGVTVTDSTFTDNGPGEGAAISVNGAPGVLSVVSATDSTFVNNDGNYGAITIDGGGVELTRVLMEDNDASGEDGGAVWAGAYLHVDDSTFRNNSGDSGGAIYASADGGHILLIENSLFENNHADLKGGAVYLEGSLTIDNSDFARNDSLDDGGALFTDDGDVTISDSTFSGNQSGNEGGGLYLYDCFETSIDRNDFLSNVAESEGGGAINFDCDDTETEAQITDNRFERNVAGDYGGATDDDDDKVLVYTRNSFIRNRVIFNDYAEGGAVWIADGRFYRNRFVGNISAQYGGGIYIANRSDGGTARRNTFQGNRAKRGSQYYYSR